MWPFPSVSSTNIEPPAETCRTSPSLVSNFMIPSSHTVSTLPGGACQPISPMPAGTCTKRMRDAGRKLERRFVWDKRYVVIGIWTSSEMRFSVRCGVDAQTSHRDLRITEVSTESAKVTLPSSSGIIRGARLAAILLRIARCLRHADKVPARF
jgi:hypothetical protein